MIITKKVLVKKLRVKHLATPEIKNKTKVKYLGVCKLLELVAWVLVAVVSGSPY